MPDNVHDQAGSLSKKPGKSVSCRLQASITIEASLAFPFFFLAGVLLALLLEMSAIDLRVRSAVLGAARQVAAETVDASEMDIGRVSALAAQNAGFDYLDRHLVEGGQGGISLAESTVDQMTGSATVRWRYRIRLPFPIFGAGSREYAGSFRIKAWNGYRGEETAQTEDTLVYVTPYGIVYHKDPGCSHLSLTVTAVGAGQVSACRNRDGGKYYPCAFCARGAGAHQTVFIAMEGDRFHTDRQCSGLKRSVEAIPLSQAGGRGPCSRCSK